MGVLVKMRTLVREVTLLKGTRVLASAASLGLLGEFWKLNASAQKWKGTKIPPSRNRNTGRGQLEVGRRRPVQHR